MRLYWIKVLSSFKKQNFWMLAWLSSIDPHTIFWSGCIDWCVCLQQITLFTKSFRLLKFIKDNSENKMSQDPTEYHKISPAILLWPQHLLASWTRAVPF